MGPGGGGGGGEGMSDFHQENLTHGDGPFFLLHEIQKLCICL